MFVYFNNQIVNANSIEQIDCNSYLDVGVVRIRRTNGTTDLVSDPDALNVIMKLAPSWFEGKRGKYARHSWLVHNFIGHPGMQLLYLLRLPKLGMWLHDITVPRAKR